VVTTNKRKYIGESSGSSSQKNKADNDGPKGHPPGPNKHEPKGGLPNQGKASSLRKVAVYY
jgi:hypothetical protein